MPEVDAYLGKSGTAELITAFKTLLAGKADLSELDKYATPDAVATAITTALTNYATNAGVQAAIATALADYMTTAEVNAAIADAVVTASGIKFESVSALPADAEAKENVIYLVPSATAADKNVKDEYMFIDGKWELLGSTAIDLTAYWSKEELRAITSAELQEMLQ